MRWMVVAGAVLVAGCATTGDVVPQQAEPTPTTQAARHDVANFVEYEGRLMADQAKTMADVSAAQNIIENIDRSLQRIALLEDDGPRLNAIISVLPDAREQAEKSASERRQGRYKDPLHGISVLLKDNIAIAGQPTTAGSLALKDNVATADAPLVARLREAGLVILGRTNLSEWANIRSTNSTSGWSAVGGLTVNPWGAGRNACGSSSGSAAAVAARFAPLAVGTETDGSITCPAGVNGVVGFKPSLGVVSGSGVVPIAHSQDTAGPMARTVADAAALLDAMRTDGRAVGTLPSGALNGVRVGVLRDRIGDDAEIVAAFDTALDGLRAKGVTIVEIADSQSGLDGLGEAELTVLLAELKTDMAAYLATTDPARVPHRTLADLIAFNKATPAELRYFDQDLFVQAGGGAGGVRGQRDLGHHVGRGRAAVGDHRHRPQERQPPMRPALPGRARQGQDAGDRQADLAPPRQRRRRAGWRHQRPGVAVDAGQGRQLWRSLRRPAARHRRSAAPNRADGAGAWAPGGDELYRASGRRRPRAGDRPRGTRRRGPPCRRRRSPPSPGD